MPERLAAAMGIALVPGVDPLDSVARYCAGDREVLVVLDNAEHVVDAVARAVDRVLTSCAGARVLVTSREPLGVTGETVWRCPSLATPAATTPVAPAALDRYDATRLFVERARSVRPNLAVDEPAATAIAEICRRLDGIPLAVELAAARARTFTLDRIADGLHDAFRLLTGGSRTVLPRQQTLLASIRWSVDTLDDSERAVFRRLAVFHAPCTLDAAEAVASDGVLVDRFDVIDIVARLVDKSLVGFDESTGRYGLLETLRQFGLGDLHQAGETAATRTRHAEWFADWAAAVARGEHGLDTRALRPDITDAMSALDWSFEVDPLTASRLCIGLAGLRHRATSLRSIEMQCDWVVAFDRTRAPEAWALAVAGTAMTAWLSRRFDVLELVPAAKAMLDPSDVHAHMLIDCPAAVIRAVQGDDRELVTLVELAEERGDIASFVAWAGSVAWLAVHTGDFDAARAMIERVRVALAQRRLQLTFDVADTAWLAQFELDVLTGALADARRAAALLGDIFGSIAYPLAADAAILALALDDPDLTDAACAATASETPAIYAHLGGFVECVAELMRGDPEAAADAGSASWADARPHGVLRGLLCVPLTLALLRANRIGEAEAHVSLWRVDVDELGRKPLQHAIALHAEALVHIASGRPDEAVATAHELLEIADQRGFALARLDALELLGVHAAAQGRDPHAARLLGAAQAERDRIGYRGMPVVDPRAIRASAADVAAATPAAWEEGGTLSIRDAVALARRGRGERGRPTHGWQSLTPTERRVADLVAEGLSNVDIATRLAMSVPTAKSHLTHVFTKLGLRNRTELAAEVLRRTPTSDAGRHTVASGGAGAIQYGASTSPSST